MVSSRRSAGAGLPQPRLRRPPTPRKISAVDPVKVIGEDVVTGPFHDAQRRLGATFYEDMGWLWTRSFGDPVAEYWAVRRDAGLWDVSALVKWRFSGTDALAALDRLTTRRTVSMAPGIVRYGVILDERGLMLDEGTTLVLGPDEAFFFGNDEREPFVEHLERHTAGFDVKIENVTARIPNIAVQGPRSFDLLSSLTETDLSHVRWFRMIPEPIAIAGVKGLLTRTGFTGELGYEFFLSDPDGAERVWDAIMDAGATPFGLDAIELLRVEAGLLIQYEDYVPGETDPYELSLDPYIELEGNDFVGREAAAERSADPRRRLVTIVFEDGEPPAAGARVMHDDADVGDVRSAVRTPRYGVLALAVIDAGLASGHEKVEVDGRPATVEAAPIDDPQKVRPRSDLRDPVTIDGPGQTW
jgi:glycine cleavage system T protein (aminomethyltransferase)